MNADAGADAVNTSSTGNAGSIGGTDNNADSKNAYAKADFNNYNVVGVNVGAVANDVIVTSEKVGSNIKNTGVGQ